MGLAVLLTLGLALRLVSPPGTRARPPAPRPARATAPLILATVGAKELTEKDLHRFMQVRELVASSLGRTKALGELMVRTQLLAFASQERTSPSDEQVQAALHRRRLLVATRTAPVAQVSSASLVPVSLAARPPIAPLELQRTYRGDALGGLEAPRDPFLAQLERRGVSVGDFAAETAADVIAEHVRDVMVFDRMEISPAEIDRELGRRRPRAAGSDMAPPGTGQGLARLALRRELARARGAAELARFLDSLQTRWPASPAQLRGSLPDERGRGYRR